MRQESRAQIQMTKTNNKETLTLNIISMTALPHSQPQTQVHICATYKAYQWIQRRTRIVTISNIKSKLNPIRKKKRF